MARIDCGADRQVSAWSQANELVFGQNSEQQCVAMSSCYLIYNNKNKESILLMVSCQ